MNKIPESLGPEIDKQIVANDLAFFKSYQEIGMDHNKVMEFIDFNQPFKEENKFFFSAPVTLKIEICKESPVKILNRKDLPDLQTVVMEDHAKISTAYFKARSSKQQFEKLQRKQYKTKLDAAERLLRCFPVVAKGLKKHGKRLLRLLPPKSSGV